MHDIKWIRENPAAFDAAMARRGRGPETPRLLELDESRPSGKGASLYQRITTAVIDGRHFITSITDAEGIR